MLGLSAGIIISISSKSGHNTFVLSTIDKVIWSSLVATESALFCFCSTWICCIFICLDWSIDGTRLSFLEKNSTFSCTYCINQVFFIVGLEPCENVAEAEVTGQDPSVLPRDISLFNFQSDDEIRNKMLTTSDVATVISSYEKTIGMQFVCFRVVWWHSG